MTEEGRVWEKDVPGRTISWLIPAAPLDDLPLGPGLWRRTGLG